VQELISLSDEQEDRNPYTACLIYLKACINKWDWPSPHDFSWSSDHGRQREFFQGGTKYFRGNNLRLISWGLYKNLKTRIELLKVSIFYHVLKC